MKSCFALFLLSLLFISCGESTPGMEDNEAVRKSFDAYKRAILAGSGAEAFQWVDSRTVAYYDHILSLATAGDSATVRALDMQDRFMVLKIRHGIPKEEVLKMNAATLFAYAVEKGMMGESQMGDMEIGEVKAEGDSAKGDLIVKGKPSGLAFTFHRESGLWKIDLTSLFPQARASLQKLLAQSGKSEDEFMTQLLEFQSDTAVGPEIWQPMK